MKKILVLLILCISGFTYSQNDTTYIQEDTTYEENWDFYYLVYKDTYEQLSADDIFADDSFRTSRSIVYKPVININVLDTINKIRVSKGSEPILYDTSRFADDLFYDMLDITREYVKQDNTPVYLIKDEDPTPECDCVNSIIEIMFSDSNTLTKRNLFSGKETETSFNEIFSDKRIKRINITYYQNSYKRKNYESLHVHVKRRRSLFTTYYYLLVDEEMK